MIQQITPRVYRIKLGAVNAYLIKDGEELTLVDSGYPKQVDKVFRALAKIGHAPEDLKRIILTHAHPDHAGSLAAFVNLLGIPAIAHAADAELIRQGIAGRLPFIVTKGFVNWLVFRLFIKNSGQRNRSLHGRTGSRGRGDPAHRRRHRSNPHPRAFRRPHRITPPGRKIADCRRHVRQYERAGTVDGQRRP